MSGTILCPTCGHHVAQEQVSKLAGQAALERVRARATAIYAAGLNRKTDPITWAVAYDRAWDGEAEEVMRNFPKEMR